MTPEEKFKNVYKENLFIMKLLTTQPEFLNNVEDVRRRIEIPEGGFKARKDKTNWYRKLLKKLPPGIDGQYQDGFFNGALDIVKKYKLKYNFLHHIENYLLYGIIDAPKYNFDVSLGPDPKGFTFDKWVSIKAFAPLTKTEIRAATKRLLSLQKEFLPDKVVLDLRPKFDIDKALRIEEEMDKRGIKILEKPSYYLEQLKKHNGEDAYRRALRLSPGKLQKEVIKYTSRDVSAKFFKSKSKDALVRTIYSRLKAKRKQLFH